MILQKNNHKSKVVDVTLRDGGLVNNFYFSEVFVKNLYKTNIAAGIDYMEFGYKSSKKLFSEKDFGIWKFCDEENIRNIVNDNSTNMKLCVMADVGRCDYKNDILPKKDSVIDLIRVATYSDDIKDAIKMIEHIKEKGYEVSCNIMAVSTNDNSKIKLVLEELGRSNADYIYIVDSYGALYPRQIENLSALYINIAEKYNKKIGIHAHNNQQLAFANTITAYEAGIHFMDASMCGLGRGAGNCSLEQLLPYLSTVDYDFKPICEFITNYIMPLKSKGIVWGYDFPYLLTGILNLHPQSAITFIENKEKNYIKYYEKLIEEFK